MASDVYRRNVNALAIIASAAFAGGNLFIGLSMGYYWMGLDTTVFMQGFWPPFTTFLYTIMPLFLLTLAGLILSARSYWLLGHIPRVILAFGIPMVALRAVFERKARIAASEVPVQ